MPEFDTYNCIKRFAEDPTDLSRMQAWAWLKRTTEMRNTWETLATSTDYDQYERRLEFRIGKRNTATGYGAGDTAAPVLTAEAYIEMSQEERLRVYAEICRAAGVEVDMSKITGTDSGA